MAETATATGAAFIDALDRNDIDVVQRLCDPAGTWWVDTGLDRAAGADDVDPGDDRPWPLHGNMRLGDKLDLLQGLPSRFPRGIRQRAWHAFGDAATAVIEVQGDGEYLGGARYQNRYAFLVDVADGRVVRIREYLDTAHAADVFDGRNLDRRTVAPPPTAASIGDTSPLARIAVEFAAGLAAGAPEAIVELTHPDATWWADSGRARAPGRLDAEPYAGPRAPVFGMARLRDRVVHVPGFVASFDAGWTLVVRRVIAGDTSVAVEVASDAARGDGVSYQNRYCFVLDVADGRICAVREYCDTLHAFDVLGM